MATPPEFSNIVTGFIVGALSFAVALSYSNFAEAVVKKYSFGGDGILANFVNLVIFTAVAVGILYLAYKSNPRAVGPALNNVENDG